MIAARRISRIDDLESFYGAANVRLRRSLYGISYPGIRDRGPGARFGIGILMEGHHSDNVNFVPDEIIQVQWSIALTAETEEHRLAAPKAFGQR